MPIFSKKSFHLDVLLSANSGSLRFVQQNSLEIYLFLAVLRDSL
jgi:hypothetical protein